MIAAACCFGTWASASAEDVLIVTRPIFSESLAEWIAYRESQGWTVHTLLTQPSAPERPFVAPEQVRKQIRSLAAAYPISALLIVGDGAPESNDDAAYRAVLPAPRIDAAVIERFGPENHIASDAWYGDLDDDGVPDLAVGRIPARCPSDMIEATKKIIRYETETQAGEWQSQIRLIAGVGGFSPIVDTVIQRSVRSMLADLLPAAMRLTLTQADWKSLYCPDPKLFRFLTLDQINAGPLFWIYMGHGSCEELDRLQTPTGLYRIMERGDAERIDVRDSAPILLFFACYAGAYDAREPAIAEALFRRPNGPVAVLASSRTAMPYAMAVFGSELLSETFYGPTATLGAAVLGAKRRMAIEGADEYQQNDPPKTAEQTEPVPATLLAIPPSVEPAALNASEEKRLDVRRRLDAMARLFDPAADSLFDERRDHIHLFNLFGDPLLRVRLPEWFEIDAPPTVRASESFTVTAESVGADGTVRVELALPLTRQALRIEPRQKFSLTDEDRVQYQKTYEAANQPVLATAEGVVKDGRFSVELPVPESLVGRYVVRAVLTGEKTLRLASRPIRVQKAEIPPETDEKSK